MSAAMRFLNVAQAICKANSLTDPSFRGSGVFKDAYFAQTADRTAIALKIFCPVKCNFCRAEREIQSMLRCDSPLIGKLYDWGIHKYTDGQSYLYIIEEYFDGGTLTDKLKPPMSSSIIHDYGITLTHAVAHLREKGLVHRDIKPDNIMFREGDNIPILVDFGLVRDLASDSLTRTYLQQGPGTPFFSSPEQLNNEKQLIDWRSDQFSTGIVLALCLTGVHPYETSTESGHNIIERVAGKSLPSDSFCHTAESSGCSFILKMIAPWPIQRFSHPSEIIRSIEKAKRGG